MRHPRLKLLLLAATSAGVSGLGPAALAQTAAGQAPPAAGAATLGEVIVTAQRRTETLQRAAVSVDVVSRAELVTNGVTDSTTLSNLVPGLTVQAAGGGLVDYFIRGVGNFTENPYSVAAVAFNYDNVYIGRPVASSGPFYDLDRVEVLKGPQGTLYGINATGGAINVIPTKPQLNAFGGYATASYGNYNAYSVEGAVNAPLGAHTALRLSGDVVGHNGYLSDGTSDEDTKAFRVQLLSDITPALTVRLSADYADIGGVGGGSNYTYNWLYNPRTRSFAVREADLSPSTGLYDGASQAYLESINAGPSGRTYDALAPRPFQDNQLYGAHAEVDYDLGFGKLTFIPAWRQSTVDDRSALPGFAFQTDENDDQYSAELRFAGKRIGIFDYSFGGLYYRETEKGAFSVNLQAAEDYTNYDTSTTSYAGFARLTAHLTDQFRLVGGIRYTSDDLSFDGNGAGLTIVCTVLVGGRPTCPSAPLFPFTASLATQPVPHSAGPGVVPLIGAGAIDARTDEALNATQTNERTTYRGALEYDVAPHSLVYASIETGFRAGGFDLARGYPTFQPEYITAYTLGSKNRFFDNRLELNGELFLWKYSNQQISHLGEDLAGNLGNITQNIGRSTNQGAEIESRYLLTPSTVVSANLQYLDAHYDTFTYQIPLVGGAPPFTGCAVSNAASAGVLNVNCSGKPSFNAPKYTLDLGLEQTLRIGSFKIVGVIDTQYLSSRFIGFDYQAGERAPAVWHTNAQVTLSPDFAKWSVSAFVQNLEDDRYPTNDIENPIGNFMVTTTAAPRVFGVRASVSF